MKVMKVLLCILLWLFVGTIFLGCQKDDVKLIEREEDVEEVAVADTISLGSKETIKIVYILSVCWYIYDRTETIQQDFDIQFRIITKGEQRPNVGCPASIIRQSTEYYFSPTKIGTYRLIFNNGNLVKNVIVLK
jgi:hypothetical protein